MTEEKDDIECRCRIGHFALDCPQASEYEALVDKEEKRVKAVLELGDVGSLQELLEANGHTVRLQGNQEQS